MKRAPWDALEDALIDMDGTVSLFYAVFDNVHNERLQARCMYPIERLLAEDHKRVRAAYDRLRKHVHAPKPKPSLSIVPDGAAD
jgi:hypothetical protein